MDHGKQNKKIIGNLLITPAQLELASELEIRHSLNIPNALMKNAKWLIQFIDLFSFDTDLEEHKAKTTTGFKRVEAVKNGHYWDTAPEQIARKVDITEKDALFMLDVLKNYSIVPLKNHQSTDWDKEEDDAYSENAAYAEEAI